MEPAPPQSLQPGTAFGYARDYLGHRLVYLTISPRARGLSMGVNLNPDRRCNFDCVYCEVDRRRPAPDATMDMHLLAQELESTLALVNSGKLRDRLPYARVPAELLQLRHVAISGDGEPTLCPQFLAAMETVVHVRAVAPAGFFKTVLITNASNLQGPGVQEGISLLTGADEIWAKLDAGTQQYMNAVNKPEVPLEVILANILHLARQRPVIIQSLFPSVRGSAPGENEIEQYALRLKELAAAGAQIPLVQIYSATRPTTNRDCGHLPLRTLSRIAQAVRGATGLRVEVF